MPDCPKMPSDCENQDGNRAGENQPGTLRFCVMEPDGDWEALTDLLHLAYREHAEAGRNYTACDQSVEQTQKRCRGNVCLLAWIGDELAGTITLVERRKGHVLYGYIMQVAVDPRFRKNGVGHQLLAQVEQIARDKGYAYLSCDTASTAKKLVKWYVKQGWIKVSCKSHKSTNYYSTVFRKYLHATPHPRHGNAYFWNCMKCHLLWKQDGSLRIAGKMAKAIRNMFRKKAKHS